MACAVLFIFFCDILLFVCMLFGISLFLQLSEWLMHMHQSGCRLLNMQDTYTLQLAPVCISVANLSLTAVATVVATLPVSGSKPHQTEWDL